MHSLDLGHGLQICCGFPSLAGAVEVTLVLAGMPVFSRAFTQGQSQAQLDLDLALLRAAGALPAGH